MLIAQGLCLIVSCLHFILLLGCARRRVPPKKLTLNRFTARHGRPPRRQDEIQIVGSPPSSSVCTDMVEQFTDKSEHNKENEKEAEIKIVGSPPSASMSTATVEQLTDKFEQNKGKEKEAQVEINRALREDSTLSEEALEQVRGSQPANNNNNMLESARRDVGRWLRTCVRGEGVHLDLYTKLLSAWSESEAKFLEIGRAITEARPMASSMPAVIDHTTVGPDFAAHPHWLQTEAETMVMIQEFDVLPTAQVYKKATEIYTEIWTLGDPKGNALGSRP